MPSDPRTARDRVLSDETVGFIKAVFNQDRRERQKAGYRYCSRGLAKRIAAELGLNLHTVLAIHENRRHRHNRSAARTIVALMGVSVPEERLKVIREYRAQKGKEARPRGFQPPALRKQSKRPARWKWRYRLPRHRRARQAPSS